VKARKLLGVKRRKLQAGHYFSSAIIGVQKLLLGSMISASAVTYISEVKHLVSSSGLLADVVYLVIKLFIMKSNMKERSN
jgi:hypothetical protein